MFQVQHVSFSVAYFSIRIFHPFQRRDLFFGSYLENTGFLGIFFRQLDTAVFKGFNLMEINKSKAFFRSSFKSPSFFFLPSTRPNTKALILPGFWGWGILGVEIWGLPDSK